MTIVNKIVELLSV